MPINVIISDSDIKVRRNTPILLVQAEREVSRETSEFLIHHDGDFIKRELTMALVEKLIENGCVRFTEETFRHDYLYPGGYPYPFHSVFRATMQIIKPTPI